MSAVFKEGWRVWKIRPNQLGVPGLGPMYADDSYTLPARWEGNRAIARCILGCQSPPGPNCRCGIRFYPHTGGLFDTVAERLIQRHNDEVRTGNPEYHGAPIVVSYGMPASPSYQDPKPGWGQYWRTGSYDVLALLGWPEYPMDVLAARHGNVPTFTFETFRSPTEALRRVANSVRVSR